MTTRLYLPATAVSSYQLPISPTPSTSWETTTGFGRALLEAGSATIGDAMATVAFTDADETNQDCLLRQYISARPLTAGQTATGSQALKAQIRGIETNAGNNLFVAIGIRIIASDGSTVRKTMLDVTRDNTELATAALTNRQFTATSAATNYTTVAGDYLVIEVGIGGDPGAGATHSGSLRLGDAAATDLPEDNADTTDVRPWIQFADTWTFVFGHSTEEMPSTSSPRRDREDRKYTYGYVY